VVGLQAPIQAQRCRQQQTFHAPVPVKLILQAPVSMPTLQALEQEPSLQAPVLVH